MTNWSDTEWEILKGRLARPETEHKSFDPWTSGLNILSQKEISSDSALQATRSRTSSSAKGSTRAEGVSAGYAGGSSSRAFSTQSDPINRQQAARTYDVIPDQTTFAEWAMARGLG
eukprot:1536410-Heterocapsa_arctica.AAC.1